MSRKPKVGPPRESWAPPQYTEFDIGSIKALASGKASEQQQIQALKCIVWAIAGTYDQSFRPGGVEGQRASDFAEGRRFVGLQLVTLINKDMPT